MNAVRKRWIILDARAAVRQRRQESDNPYPEGSEEHTVWLAFHRMTLTDALRNDLIDSEYKASAY